MSAGARPAHPRRHARSADRLGLRAGAMAAAGTVARPVFDHPRAGGGGRCYSTRASGAAGGADGFAIYGWLIGLGRTGAALALQGCSTSPTSSCRCGSCRAWGPEWPAWARPVPWPCGCIWRRGADHLAAAAQRGRLPMPWQLPQAGFAAPRIAPAAGRQPRHLPAHAGPAGRFRLVQRGPCARRAGAGRQCHPAAVHRRLCLFPGRLPTSPKR